MATSAAVPVRTPPAARTRARIGGVVAVSALGLAVAGCGGNYNADGNDGAGSSPAAPSGSASIGGASPRPYGLSPKFLKTPPVPRNRQGALSDVFYNPNSCDTAAGRQRLSGTVRNSTDSTTDYVITISWVSGTNDTLGRGFTVVRDLRPGRRVRWTVVSRVAEGAKQCVPEVTRGQVS